jgi:hypothetical protein
MTGNALGAPRHAPPNKRMQPTGWTGAEPRSGGTSYGAAEEA